MKIKYYFFIIFYIAFLFLPTWSLADKIIDPQCNTEASNLFSDCIDNCTSIANKGCVLNCSKAEVQKYAECCSQHKERPACHF